ncbi:hypothetical protein [Mucilaginibacter sp. UYCu711]|uniref:hypothetical protein n=1 Tax=Mucilaginibacter sp. UYCu711 TaxID=3156339 RepID=UPI003D1D0822
METILLQINDVKAYKLIEDLEALNVVKILEKDIQPKKKLSERFAGALKLSKEESENFQKAIIEGRNEWERDI